MGRDMLTHAFVHVKRNPADFRKKDIIFVSCLPARTYTGANAFGFVSRYRQRVYVNLRPRTLPRPRARGLGTLGKL